MNSMSENWFDMFMNKYNEEVESMSTANIMIIGKTGVGKSTLINNVFREKLVETGIGKPVTQHISKITKKGVPLTIYDTKGLELDSDVQEEIKKEIIGQIDRTLLSQNEKDYIHVAWYCINSSSNRIEDFEVDWINEFSKKLPVIIVMTQCMGLQYKEFESYIRNLNLPVVNVVPTLAEEIVISEEITIPPFGLTQLVDVTYNCLDEAAKKAFINAQKVNLEKKVVAARLAVLPYVSTNFVTGFTPIPFADATILVPSQIAMIAHLTVIFGINVEKTLITSIITAIGGVGGATALGRTIVANVVKFIPGVGTAVGGVISGTTAAILTAALGYAYIEVMNKIAVRLYEGKKIDNNEIITMMKKAYEDQLKKGKNIITGTK
ncbi:MAG: GTP-binding protein [Firmicutes bacterium HGW-Firmicutes-3]|jgi:uncharacterized protein (DUF697 family)/GTP-binding protein EngB required for normal cell division|nr:MAG: GTP-binding protein [Firmicutes bacterium HGW-Firmicutes-3]